MASRRIPLLPVVAATALAVAAATGVFLFLGGDDGSSGASGAGSDETSSLELTPTGDLPASAEEVVLGGLGGARDRHLGDYLGRKPVVLNFFASWCTPCLQEMPRFEAVHQDVGDGVTFLGIAFQDRTDRAERMVERTGVTYPTFADPNGDALTFFGGIAMPTTVFIDRSGAVTDVVSQELSEGALREQVDAMLAGRLAAGSGG